MKMNTAQSPASTPRVRVLRPANPQRTTPKRKTHMTATTKPTNATSTDSPRISARRRLEIQLLDRHRRKCLICRHPERRLIEEEFLHWRAPWDLAREHQLADYRTLYRHARATGLDLKRRENLHSVLDLFVEAADEVTVTGDMVFRAMRAYSCIDRRGRWTDPPTRVNFSTLHDACPASPDGSRTIHLSPAGLHDDPSSCAGSPAQALGFDSELDADLDETLEDDLEEEATARNDCVENSLAETVTACAASPAQVVASTKGAVLDEDATACAASAAQALGFDADLEDALEENLEEQFTACAGSPAQALGFDAELEDAQLGDLEQAGRNEELEEEVATACAAPPAQRLASTKVAVLNEDATSCAASPAQPPPGAQKSAPQSGTPLPQQPTPPVWPGSDYPPDPSSPHFQKLVIQCVDPVTGQPLRRGR